MPLDALNQQLKRLHRIHQRDHLYHTHLHITFSNFLIWMPYGNDVPFILYRMVWVGMAHDIRERILGDSIFFLPLEGNHVAAQDQHALYNYQKWRGGKRGIGLLSYHVHLFSPPTLHEPKVGEILHELPCWRVTPFIWMIAWGWRFHLGMRISHAFQTPCLKRTSRYHIAVSLSTLILHDDIHLKSTPNANVLA